jgi:hypothetical protein
VSSESSTDVEREQASVLPSSGPAWDAAVAYGIDMKLLMSNLALSPAERLRRLQQTANFHAMLRAARRAGE